MLENTDTVQLTDDPVPSMLNSFFTDNLYIDSQYVSANITSKHIDGSVQDPILTDKRNELPGNLGM